MTVGPTTHRHPDPAHILTWNRGAERLKGYQLDEIVGKHFSIFYPEEDKARGKPDWELEVAEAEGRFEDEGWRVRKDGSLFITVTSTSGQGATFTLSVRRVAEPAAAAD